MIEPRLYGEVVGGSIDEVYRDLVWYLMRFPEHEPAPRGQPVREQLATTLVITEPRNRILVNRARETNYGFAVGEFLWYWRGARDLGSILYYNKRMSSFSDDGKTLNSAYGHRLRVASYGEEDDVGRGYSMTQWEACVKTLTGDPDSRRAVMLIDQPIDQVRAAMHGSKDVPCTLSIQFFIRDHELDMHVVMRSNDVVWGLTYDAFSFSLLHECMLLELKEDERFAHLQLGTYYHTAGSIHIYGHHFQLCERILQEYGVSGRTILPSDYSGPVGVMEEITSLRDLNRLCVDEDALRTGRIRRIDLNTYHGGLRWMAEQLNAHREKRDAQGA